MNRPVLVIALALAAGTAGSVRGASEPLRVLSPDNQVAITFRLQPEGAPAYQVDVCAKPLVLESRLGLEPGWTNHFTLLTTASSSHQGQWTNLFGERKMVPDHYRQLDIDLKHASGGRLRLAFRAYDEGAAWRYSLPAQAQKEFHFSGEQTEFRFPADTYGFEEHSTEADYRRVKTSDLQPWCERPLTLEYASGLFASLGEAANQHYPRMLLSPLPGVPGALVSALGGTTANSPKPSQRHDPNATLQAGDSTPWRYFLVGHRPGELLERNYLLLDLNPPAALNDLSWVKAGKVMRDTTLTTTNSKAIIDFAQKAGLQYVALDDRWYGQQDPKTGDATTVRVPKLRIQEIVRYGQQKGVAH